MILSWKSKKKSDLKNRIRYLRKAYFIIGFCFISHFMFSQNMANKDSLIQVIEEDKSLDDSIKLDILYEIFADTFLSLDKRLKYAEMALDIATQKQDQIWLFRAKLDIGHIYKKKGELKNALNYFLQSLVHSQKLDDKWRESLALSAIGSVYRVQENYGTALKFYNRSITKLRIASDSVNLAKSLMNVGELYRIIKVMDTALFYFEESSKIFNSLDYKLGSAYNLGNIGLVYAEQGKHASAQQNLKKAIEILNDLEDYYPIAVYDTYISDIYLKKGDFKRALQYAQHSLEISLEHGLKEQIRDASLKLARLYELQQDYQQAFEFQKQYLAYRDSINNEETIRKMADLRTEYEVSQKQTEIDLLESRQSMQYILFASMGTVIILLAFLAFLYYRNNKRKQMLNIIITERKEEVEAQRDQLEAMNETREKFLSIIAHDLLGPVNSFKGFSTIMRFSIDENDTKTLNEMHSQFDKSVNGLSTLLTDLLDWSVTQQGNIPYKPESVDLKTLSDELINLFTNMAEGKRIRLTSTITEPINMFVDLNSVKTILRNLVSNAIKFTPAEGTIQISANLRQDHVEISVKDSGIGMSEEKRLSLLHKTEYDRSWGTKGEKGLGLGLQLVREFTEMNKGSLTIESEEGVGSTISLDLPLKK